jgi:hypothetical protein
MSFLWNLNLDEYLEIVKRAKKAGVKEGESIEDFVLDYMKEKGYTPMCETDKDLDLICGEMREQDPSLKILNMNEVQRRLDNEKN